MYMAPAKRFVLHVPYLYLHTLLGQDARFTNLIALSHGRPAGRLDLSPTPYPVDKKANPDEVQQCDKIMIIFDKKLTRRHNRCIASTQSPYSNDTDGQSSLASQQCSVL